MNFNRLITNRLIEWKNKKNRKPLVLRGARQVGKTTLINQFGTQYKNYIYLNLEKKEDYSIFTDFSNVQDIVEFLFLRFQINKIDKSNTLLFIDVIQESVNAIALLRYFYEEEKDLHVIAAGSLLEQVIKQVKNFPVGRIEYLYVHPLNFKEFLLAKNQEQIINALNQIPIPNYAHELCKKLFHEYIIIGGMPEIVKEYLEINSLSDLLSVYESIWETYKNDVEKYENNKNQARVIKHIMQTAHLYLDERIKFQNFGNSNYKSREVSEAFKNLHDAKIIKLIYPTNSTELPIKPNIQKSPRMQFLDTGLVNYALNIQAEMLKLDDFSTLYKGAIIPHIIYQELIAEDNITNNELNFWVRDAKNSSAEVDLVIRYKNLVIPIEIKSGKVGKLKSLHSFIESVDHNIAIRVYGGQLSIEKHHTIQLKKEFILINIPYYLTPQISNYIDYTLTKIS
jgi:predicted AAA+ superfamily ATPase